MYTLVLVVHVVVSLVLIVVVLLQSSKGGGLAGAFGGGGGSPQQMLGSRGMTTLLHKLTIYCAVAFFATSFLLFMTQSTPSGSSGNLINQAAQEGELNVPVTEIPASAPLEVPAETPADDTGGGN